MFWDCDKTFDMLDDMYMDFLMREDSDTEPFTDEENRQFDVLSAWYDMYEDFMQLTDDTLDELNLEGF